MKTTTSYSFHALFLALSFLLVAPALGQQPDRVGTREVKTAQWRGKHIQYVEGKVSVKLKEGANKGVARNAVQAVVGRTLQDFDELGWGFLEVPEDQSVLDVVSELEKLPSVSIAHPVSVGTIGTTPDDDFLSNQWGLINTSQNAGTADSDIDADLAWDHTTGSSNVVIAVLDTGIPMQGGSLSHNDLDDPNKIILGPDYTDETDGTVQDNHGHGTHVAGIAAAETNNDKGVAGTCWSCKMLVVQTNLGEPLENLPAGYYEADWFYNGVLSPEEPLPSHGSATFSHALPVVLETSCPARRRGLAGRWDRLRQRAPAAGRGTVRTSFFRRRTHLVYRPVDAFGPRRAADLRHRVHDGSSLRSEGAARWKRVRL